MAKWDWEGTNERGELKTGTIEAANMEEAVALAADCPFVDCTRVYEVKSG